VGNDVLRRRLAEAKMTERELAETIGAATLTITRWITEDRLPHSRLRWAAAEALGCDEVEIWPRAARAMIKTGPDREVHAVYLSHDEALPQWRQLIVSATEEIAVSAFDFYFLWRLIPDLSELLRAKVELGCRARFILGDRANPIVAADERSTGAPVTLGSRVDQTRQFLEPLRDVVQIRESALGFGRSVYRADSDALLVTWPHGISDGNYPVQHLRRRLDGGIFDQLAVRHVDALWESAEPVVWP